MNYLIFITVPEIMYYLTSGNDRQREGTWVWESTQHAVTYTRWGSRQPEGKEGEDCLVLSIHASDHFWEWHDISCGKQSRFICEK